MKKELVLDNCLHCGKPMDHNIKHIMAYKNRQPIYSNFCKNCIKAHWLEFKKNHLEMWRVLNEK